MRAFLLIFIAAFLVLITGSPSLLRAQEVPKPTTLAAARTDFDAADQELNRVYRQCTAPDYATVQSIAALKQSQELWVRYRDANAAAYRTGQSSRHVTKDQYYFYASTVITRSRIKELQTLFLQP